MTPWWVHSPGYSTLHAVTPPAGRFTSVAYCGRRPPRNGWVGTRADEAAEIGHIPRCRWCVTVAERMSR